MYLVLNLVFILIGCSQQDIVLDELYKLGAPNYFTSKIADIVQSQKSQNPTLCLQQLSQYKDALYPNFEDWAIRMFDATGKIPAGFLQGNTDMGSFDACLNVKSPQKPYIIGQYCKGTINLQMPQNFQRVGLHFNATDVVVPDTIRPRIETASLPLQLALCVPSSCSALELTMLFNASNLPAVFSHNDCQTKDGQPKLDAGAIAFICFVAIILTLMLLSTMYETYYYYKGYDAPHQSLIIFSILSNGKKLLSTNNSPDVISCLHGIRAISIIWVVIGHSYVWMLMYPLSNYSYLFEWMNDVSNMFIIGATISVDTFFLLSGLALSYCYLVYKRKGKKFNLLLFYIHRYIRLTPVMAVIIFFYLTLMKNLGSGPLWPASVSSAADACKTNWWKALLYFQNYGDMETCVAQTWYLSVDTQLYVLSPLILLPLSVCPKPTLIGTGILTVLSIVGCFLTGWFYELNGLLSGNLDPEQIKAYFKYYYSATHTRAAVWLIGILYGYLLFKVKNNHPKFSLHKLLVLISWLISLAVLVTCVYGGHHLTLQKPIDKLENSLYISLVRPAWAVALGWIIFVCFMGYGGPVNWFLSLPAFEVLGKLSYCIYLIHCAVMYIQGGQVRVPQIFSNFNAMNQFWGYFGFTLVFSLLLYLGVEYPVILIEQKLIEKITGETKNKTQSDDHDKTTTQGNYMKQP